MRLLAALALACALFAGVAHAADAEDKRTVQCGGFPLWYGTTIASIGPLHGRPRIASVMALGAVTTEKDSHARAWVVWDETGTAWLGIAKHSPADLRQLWKSPEPPDFRFGVRVRFTPLTTPLPKAYRITDCHDALPYSG